MTTEPTDHIAGGAFGTASHSDVSVRHARKTLLQRVTQIAHRRRCAVRDLEVGDDDPGLVRVRTILATAAIAESDAALALLGDKRFLFSASGRCFLMFGVRGRSWLALGAPVGCAEDRLGLMRRFVDLARSHAARPVFFGLNSSDLPDALEVGLWLQKISETAVAPRYVATPSMWTLPIALIDLCFLSSGGVRSLVKRAKHRAVSTI